jgi:cytochrome b pre-mRNA-processing protein 3
MRRIGLLPLLGFVLDYPHGGRHFKARVGARPVSGPRRPQQPNPSTMPFIKRFFGSTRDNDPVAWALYEACIAQARQPAFYSELGVPDTLDGRFELISLHVYLVLRRLRLADGESGELGQNLFDAMFSDMDRSLREMGAGDVGVGPRVKKMARAFYGRISAYDAALDGTDTDATLDDAVRRNLYGTVPAPAPAWVSAMCDYIRREDAHLAEQDTAELRRGRIDFGDAQPA